MILVTATGAVLIVAVGVLAWRLHQIEAHQAKVDARVHELGLVKGMIDEARTDKKERRRGMWVVSILVALVCL